MENAWSDGPGDDVALGKGSDAGETLTRGAPWLATAQVVSLGGGFRWVGREPAVRVAVRQTAGTGGKAPTRWCAALRGGGPHCTHREPAGPDAATSSRHGANAERYEAEVTAAPGNAEAKAPAYRGAGTAPRSGPASSSKRAATRASIAARNVSARRVEAALWVFRRMRSRLLPAVPSITPSPTRSGDGTVRPDARRAIRRTGGFGR